MIWKLAVALGPVALVLLVSELLWRSGKLKGERARKFIHILAGSWVAFWPQYLPFDGIMILAVAMLVMLIYSRATNLFHAIYAVKRKTYGDILYAAGLLATAGLAREPWIFTIAILLLALADGSAAVAGRLYGRRQTYRVFGSKHLTKSFIGTAAFLIFAYVSIAIGWLSGGADVLRENIVLAFVLLPVISTALENSVPYGFDNFVTPVFATLLLNTMV